MALTLDIELFTQLHYRQSISRTPTCPSCSRTCSSTTGRRRASTRSSTSWNDPARRQIDLQHRSRSVDELIELVVAIDGILQEQAAADAAYFVGACGRAVDDDEAEVIKDRFLKAYRWQYIHSGAAHPRFQATLSGMITESEGRRVAATLATLQ